MSALIEVHAARIGGEPNSYILDVTVDAGTGPIRLPYYVHRIEDWQAVDAAVRAWVLANPGNIDLTPPDPAGPLDVPLPRREFRLAMLDFGLTDQLVEDALATVSDPVERQRMTIFWQDTQSFERYHPVLIALASAAGLTVEQIDDMWAHGVAILHGEGVGDGDGNL